MSLRENRFVIGILLSILYEIGLVESYLIFRTQNIELSLFLPMFLLVFPAFILYIFSPYVIIRLSGATTMYHSTLIKHMDQIFLLNSIDLPIETRDTLKTNIVNDLMPQLIAVYRRQYIDSYFVREQNSTLDRMLSFRESMFLLSITFGFTNFINSLTILYLYIGSIDLDFLNIDQIVNPVNIIFFFTVFFSFFCLSIFLFGYNKRHLCLLISQTSYNIIPFDDDINSKRRKLELESIRRFPLIDEIGSKLSSNWDLVSKLYFDFIDTRLREQIYEFTKKNVAKSLVLEEYSSLIDKLDVPTEKKKELEFQFYLGIGFSDAIEEIVSSSEEESESIKLDIVYAKKKLEDWGKISTDEQLAMFMFLWRSTETLFRHVLWKIDKFPKDDQSWLSINNTMLRENLMTIGEGKILKRIRQHRNAILHRSQDRFVAKEDIEDLLKLLERVLDRI